MPNLNLNELLAIVFVGFLFYIVLRVLIAPVKLVLRLLLSALVGAGLLVLFNWVGGFFGLFVGINFVTSFVVGFMGLPGLLMIILLQRMLA